MESVLADIPWKAMELAGPHNQRTHSDRTFVVYQEVV